jgi:hypothetical protein
VLDDVETATKSEQVLQHADDLRAVHRVPEEASRGA